MNGPQNTDWSTGVSLTSEIWVHLAVTYNGSSIILYKDGEESASTQVSGSLNLATNSNPLYVGYNTEWTNECWSGLIDDVRIYDRTLNAGEILALNQTGSEQVYHKADTNNDGIIDTPELMMFIGRWKANDNVTKQEVESARGIWFGGGGY